MRRFAFSVIATTVLGLNASRRDRLFADFELWTKALFSVPLAVPGTPFARILAAAATSLKQLKAVQSETDNPVEWMLMLNFPGSLRTIAPLIPPRNHRQGAVPDARERCQH